MEPTRPQFSSHMKGQGHTNIPAMLAGQRDQPELQNSPNISLQNKENEKKKCQIQLKFILELPTHPDALHIP
jgi:hypothetical protein